MCLEKQRADDAGENFSDRFVHPPSSRLIIATTKPPEGLTIAPPGPRNAIPIAAAGVEDL